MLLPWKENAKKLIKANHATLGVACRIAFRMVDRLLVERR
jgi:hypothetical protein